MSESRYYRVAEHSFCISGEPKVLSLMQRYSVFQSLGCNALFTLTVEEGKAPIYIKEYHQEDEGQDIICGHTENKESIFELRWQHRIAGWLVCSSRYHTGKLIITNIYTKLAIDNALMIMFALATAEKSTVLFHASAVSYRGQCYLFLGKSGTGKSTHAALWQKHIDGVELVNDDNPVVRIGERGATVYGSPWSGKTPCYRNVSYPLGGIVLLSQAPYNKIRRLGNIEAFAALITSISGKRWDSNIADGLHNTESELIRSIPTWYLECLPNKDAAQVCANTISNNKEADDQE